MPTAYVHLREEPHYRRVAFINGFARLGYVVVQGQPQPPKPIDSRDVCLIWNRTPRSRYSFEAADAAGAACLVAENGYAGVDRNGVKPYAIALDGHTGSGRWFVGDADRLDALELDFQPMRPLGDRALLVGQRGIGSIHMRSPHAFLDNTRPHLERKGWSVLERKHPGIKTPERPLSMDLGQVNQVVVWSSNVATQALIQGLPAFYAAPTIVTAGAAKPLLRTTTVATEDERRAAFTRMAWAQWTIDEIDSGEAIKTLLDVHAGVLSSCTKDAA